jgi:hypothetical protein
MSVKSNSTVLFTALFLSITIGTQARSAEAVSVVALCEANPACSHSEANKAGNVVLKLRGPGNSKTILCDADGKCTMLLPRGQKLSIWDLPAVIGAK